MVSWNWSKQLTFSKILAFYEFYVIFWKPQLTLFTNIHQAFLNHWPRFFNNLKIQFFQNLNFSGISGSFFSDCFPEFRYSYSSGISESEFFPKLLWENSAILTFLEIWIFLEVYLLLVLNILE